MDTACYMLKQMRAFDHLRFYYVYYFGIIQRVGKAVGNDCRRTRHMQRGIYLEIISHTSFLRAYTVVGIDPQFFNLYTRL